MQPFTDRQIITPFLQFSPEKIILFGSAATGKADEFSDIDLIIVYETQKRFLDRLRDLYMAWNLPRAVDILAYTPEEFALMITENPFVQDAVAEGRVLHEKAH